MARQIQSRLKISGTLIAMTPLHIGGNGSNAQVDLALAVNGQGQYYIPGTSLAGALRGWMQADEFNQALWGHQKEKEREGHASYVLVEDAPIQSSAAEVRDGIGVDRRYGTAANQAKFDRAILPKGTRIPLEMTVEQGKASTTTWESQKAYLAELLQALEQEKIRLGASKTRGLGRIKLENLKILEQQLSTPAGVLQALRAKGTTIPLNGLSTQTTPYNQSSELAITIHWQPVSPLMVKTEADGIAVDALPLTTAIGDQVTFILPGSSIKGALRSQAERIVRTVRSLPITQNSKFNEQIEDRELSLIHQVFGVPSKFNQQKQQQGKIGALLLDDCCAKLRISSKKWNQVTAATDESQLRNALDTANLKATQHAFHVAVDRWTGGAADSALYSTLEPMDVEWEPIQLTLNFQRIDNLYHPVAIALLLLVLRDLSFGRVSLGYATNRGMGAIAIQHIRLQSSSQLEFLKPLTDVTLTNGDITGLPSALLEFLSQSWQQWAD